jgi:hypothetical protein
MRRGVQSHEALIPRLLDLRSQDDSDLDRVLTGPAGTVAGLRCDESIRIGDRLERIRAGTGDRRRASPVASHPISAEGARRSIIADRRPELADCSASSNRHRFPSGVANERVVYCREYSNSPIGDPMLQRATGLTSAARQNSQ